ncbi:peptide/nickel transport system ATP-binding protein [Nitratireductor aquibiodomus]|uniref:Peptide/nickel transport system ATP-binding protein n=2 Tax=Nitratireductor aquibiodomus TaxID=204799 RepID=A0A1H4JN95_9HYPH|nr:ATP-binding cassette domain-containing protein [Nitratireductor aquibiodomus]SEB47791.1 peptide/nickel transport system ATP-binding protein [Nitratireductor aquibiodomus]
MPEPLLVAQNLCKTFTSRGRRVTALDDVSLTLAPGETLGLVGASGSGKSTLARVLLRLLPADAGAVRLQGEDWLQLRGRALRRQRRAIQMVFQDPLAAFNPRATIGAVLADPLRIHGLADRAVRPVRVGALLERVGLPAGYAARGVHDVSGGERQRVAIARALAARPSLIVFDEPVSALDQSIRGEILKLIADLQKSEGLSYLFIAHDLAVVRLVSHRVAIMESGRVVETGPTSQIIDSPQSPAGKALVAAVPRLEFPRAQ